MATWNMFESMIKELRGHNSSFKLTGPQKMALWFALPELRSKGFTGKFDLGGNYVDPTDYYRNAWLLNSQQTVIYLPRRGTSTTLTAMLGKYMDEHNGAMFGGYITMTKQSSDILQKLVAGPFRKPILTSKNYKDFLDASKIYLLDVEGDPGLEVLNHLKSLNVSLISFLASSEKTINWARDNSASYLKIPAKDYPRDWQKNMSRFIESYAGDKGLSFNLGIV